MELYQYEKEHYDLMRRYAPECMVLLKSNGDFPLKTSGQIALYGSGARRTIKGGTGSGEVNSRFVVTVEQGLENAGFVVTTKAWLDGYDGIRRQEHENFVAGIKEKARKAGVPAVFLGMGVVMPEPEYELPLGSGTDTAIYVLARISGEGSDRNAVKGDLKLTDTEIRDILTLRKKYRHFLLVLNVSGVVDLTPVMEVENILILSQLGAATGDALADVLLGKAYPSGKLTATWAPWDDYCKEGDFGDPDDTRYREGIYVGYRYFDSVGKVPLFPFGFGLGYTTFSIGNESVTLDGSRVCVTAKVTNTGSCPGKEVVQLYVSVPAGKLDQPYQILAAFTKTKELLPGETQQVRLSFGMEEIASFDTDRACNILEQGSYLIRIGNSSRNGTVCAAVTLNEEVVVHHLSNSGGKPDFVDWRPEHPVKLGKNPDVPVLNINKDAFAAEERVFSVVPEKIQKLVKKLSDSGLAYLCVGDFRSGEKSKSVIGSAAHAVAGAGGETASRIDGVPSLVMADGPAGIRISQHYGVDEQGIYQVGNVIPATFADYVDEKVLAAFGFGQPEPEEHHGKIYDQYCTAIPIGTALAQTWNLEFCQMCGDLVGNEMDRFGIHLWLAPALNIHRSPLCGRNYEYFSEDPLVSGKVAAAIAKGVQSHPGRGVTIKHFACNNQETNRFHSNSIVSQRALRDIYLRGFEICVHEARPMALMTSYNLLNGIHTSERRDLVTTILREEWGFDGMVMSDWVIAGMVQVKKKYPYATAAKSIKAGNDIMMPGSQGDYEGVMTALNGTNPDVTLTRQEMEECAARIVRTVLKLTKEGQR